MQALLTVTTLRGAPSRRNDQRPLGLHISRGRRRATASSQQDKLEYLPPLFAISWPQLRGQLVRLRAQVRLRQEAMPMRARRQVSTQPTGLSNGRSSTV